MTQKRFKKLLMSKGYSRNEANAIIQRTIKCRIPYAKAIKMYSITINISCTSKAFIKAMKQLGDAVRDAGNSIKELNAHWIE